MKDQIKLINDFTSRYLNGDIERLATFELGKLSYDRVFGCPGTWFDPDNTNLMRAIYYVVYGKIWNISYSDIEYKMMRGDTLNTYNTLFGYPSRQDFSNKWHPDNEFVEKRKQFNFTCFSMGNMTILPNIALSNWTINKYRGCHDQWRDYEDRFLAALRPVLLGDKQADLGLKKLVDLNQKYFVPFYGEQGWRNYIEGNMLEYYVDDDYIPIISSKGYTYWQVGYANRDRFFAECHRYMDFTTNLVKDRASRIIAKLKDAGVR